MDIKLENLKGQLGSIAAKISDSEITIEEVQGEIFKVMGNIDTITEHYEEIKYSIQKLL